jgi:hypothetical protein
LAFFSKIINCFTNIFDSKQLKYSPKVYIFALRRENGNSRRNEPLFLVSVDKLPTCCVAMDRAVMAYKGTETDVQYGVEMAWMADSNARALLTRGFTF